MFSAVVLLCQLANVSNCMAITTETPFRRIEQCESAYVVAQAAAERTGSIFVAGFECINWGEPS